MVQRIRLADVNDATLADAELVLAVDPRLPGFRKEVWRQGLAAEDFRELEVEINSRDAAQIRTLRNLIESQDRWG